MLSTRSAVLAIAMPGLAAFAAAQSNSLAVPVLLEGNWSSTADTSSNNPEDWTGRFDLDIIDWLCRYASEPVHSLFVSNWL